MKSKRALEIENEALRSILKEIGEMTAVLPKRDGMAALIGMVGALTEEDMIALRIQRVGLEKKRGEMA